MIPVFVPRSARAAIPSEERPRSREPGGGGAVSRSAHRRVRSVLDPELDLRRPLTASRFSQRPRCLKPGIGRSNELLHVRSRRLAAGGRGRVSQLLCRALHRPPRAGLQPSGARAALQLQPSVADRVRRRSGGACPDRWALTVPAKGDFRRRVANPPGFDARSRSATRACRLLVPPAMRSMKSRTSAVAAARHVLRPWIRSGHHREQPAIRRKQRRGEPST